MKRHFESRAIRPQAISLSRTNKRLRKQDKPYEPHGATTKDILWHVSGQAAGARACKDRLKGQLQKLESSHARKEQGISQQAHITHEYI